MDIRNHINWRTILYGTTLVSVVFNAAHGWSATQGWVRPLAAAAAAIPPIGFFAIVEALTRPTERTLRSVWMYRTAVFLAAVLAAVAFVVSFATIKAAVVTLGFLPDERLAWGFPLIFDSLMAASSLMIQTTTEGYTKRKKVTPEPVTERRWIGLNELARRTFKGSPTPEHTVVAAPERPTLPERKHSVENVSGTRKSQVNTRAQAVTEPMPETAPDFGRSVNGSVTEFEYATEARDILERTGKRTPIEAVVAVLERLDEPDAKVSVIASELAMGERTVRGIRDARRPHLVQTAI